MKSPHVHSDAITALWVVAIALVGFNAVKLGSAYLVNKGGTAAKIGATTGALVHFGS
jgi:hypothetical protein